MHISINTEFNHPMADMDTNRWVAYLESLGQVMALQAEVELSVTFTDNETIQQLNHQFRHVDQPTDVLAFPQDMENNLLGDVIVSVEKAEEQAREKGHSLQWELALLVTHGFLHLLGFDHYESKDEKVMFAQQDELLAAYFEGCFEKQASISPDS